MVTASFVYRGPDNIEVGGGCIDRRGEVDVSLSDILAARPVDSVPVWSRSTKDSADINSDSLQNPHDDKATYRRKHTGEHVYFYVQSRVNILGLLR